MRVKEIQTSAKPDEKSNQMNVQKLVDITYYQRVVDVLLCNAGLPVI